MLTESAFFLKSSFNVVATSFLFRLETGSLLMVPPNLPVFTRKPCSASSCCLSQGPLVFESLSAKASFLAVWGLGSTVFLG